MADKAFNITRGQGFQLLLPNGLTLSTQFGPTHYVQGRSLSVETLDMLTVPVRLSEVNTASNDAEIAILDSRGDFVTNEVLGEPDACDDVRGWVDMNEWLAILQKALAYTGNVDHKAIEEQYEQDNS